MDYLTIITEALEKARRAELENLRQKLISHIENLPCVSTKDHEAFREGHKQAREAMIEVVGKIWPD